MNYIGSLLGGKTLVSGLIAIAIIASVVLGCTCDDNDTSQPDNNESTVGNTTTESSAENDKVPKTYLGEWTGEDDSLIEVRADGSGDYRSGNLKITGGRVTIDNSAQTLSITFFGLGKTLKIDRAPENNTMTLNGIVYSRKGGFRSDPTAIPPADKLQSLAKRTFLDFNAALQKKDFSEFHGTLSKPFQKGSSATQLAEVFKGFFGLDFSQVTEMDANFTDAPAIVDFEGFEMLQLNGYYPTTPRRTRFEFKYIFEEGEWKLGHIRVNTKI